jgi:O-antigen ligase
MSRPNLEAAVVNRARVPRLALVADGLAAAVAVSLPWSTSATGILIALWLVALVPTLDAAALRREVMSPAGGLPILLWGIGALGMLWADVSWSERIAGMSGFHKLLMIPLLLAQFRRPAARGEWVILGFLFSSLLLLAVSWALVLTPGLSWRGSNSIGVPVKNYILQSALFAICAFALIGQAAELWRTRLRLALAALLGAAAFIANIVYVSTARTTLVVLAAMLLLIGLRQSGWKGALGAVLIGGVLAGAAWASSPYLRARVTLAIEETESYSASDIATSTGLRLEYWKRSLAFVAQAPIIGHGTGTIPQLFRRDVPAEAIGLLRTTNPHSQILAVAIELGCVGTIALLAMWVAHLALFREGVVRGEATLVAWFGLILVVYNVVSSIFNSHLFDFGQGWLYVFGLGVTGGMVLRGTRIAHEIDNSRAAPT